MSRKRNKRKNGKGTLIGILAVIAVLLVGIVLVLVMQEKKSSTVVRNHNKQTADGTDVDATDYSVITYNGEEYTYKKDLKTILFLGIDKNQDDVDPEFTGTAGRSDCMILFLVNTKENTAQMVSIPRESMTDVEIYSVDGQYLGMVNEQITLQYSYGDGGKRSCWLTKKTLSKMLKDIPIDAYMSMELDGISDITTILGGVTLTVPEDYTSVDPSFVQGATLNLQGDLAEKYVRKRDVTVYASNEGRMERQNQFVRAFVPQMKAKFSSDIQSLLDMTKNYLTTDMDVDDMKSLMGCSLTDETLTIPGQRISTGDNTPEEYHLDEDALMQMIVDLCYDKK